MYSSFQIKINCVKLYLVGYILEYKLLEKHPLKIDGNSRISNTAVEHYRRMDLIGEKNNEK